MASNKKDRSDPKVNKSLAIRNVLREMTPTATAAQIAQVVKARYGHTVTPTLIYLVKSKQRQLPPPVPAAVPARAAAQKTVRSTAGTSDVALAIRGAKQMLAALGTYAEANAVLKAVADR